MNCTHDCNQGRSCTCYRGNFDHLGQPYKLESAWTKADMAIVAITIFSATGLIFGWFGG